MAELFRKVDFFKDLDEVTLNKFASIATIQNFQHGETIMLAGDTRRAIFFIARGQAKVFSDSKNSRNSILNLIATGDFFGEVQLFSESAKSYFSIKAEGECSVIIFKGKDFINEITNTPKLLIAFLKATTQKLSKTYMQIESLSMSTIKGRIRSCLMQFIEETDKKNRPTQQQIAAMCGTTRETVNRELSFLIKNGYIKLDGKNLILLKALPQ
jgi:CRP-like cAMP-binding protein